MSKLVPGNAAAVAMVILNDRRPPLQANDTISLGRCGKGWAMQLWRNRRLEWEGSVTEDEVREWVAKNPSISASVA